MIQQLDAVRALGAARVSLGAIFLVRTTAIGTPIHRWSLGGAPLLGWPDAKWHGSAAFLDMPPNVTAGMCVLRTFAALAFLLGIRPRASGIVAGLAGYAVAQTQPFGFVATLHLLYLGTILLACAGSGGALALRPETPAAPESGRWLVRVFVASVYAWSAAAKLGSDWLSGRTLELYRDSGGFSRLFSETVLASSTARSITAWSVVLLELSLAPLLLWRRTTILALPLAYAFHVALELVAKPDSLGWQMAALLICFLPLRSRTVADEQSRR